MPAPLAILILQADCFKLPLTTFGQLQYRSTRGAWHKTTRGGWPWFSRAMAILRLLRLLWVLGRDCELSGLTFHVCLGCTQLQAYFA